MAGKSPVKANDEQIAALEALAGSRDRGEADRARAILLTLAGWTSARIAEVFRVREDSVRFWRGDFARGGVAEMKASIYAGPPPVKTVIPLTLSDGPAFSAFEGRPAGPSPASPRIAPACRRARGLQGQAFGGR